MPHYPGGKNGAKRKLSCRDFNSQGWLGHRLNPCSNFLIVLLFAASGDNPHSHQAGTTSLELPGSSGLARWEDGSSTSTETTNAWPHAAQAATLLFESLIG